eukprot:3447808-Prymnesium_polylepis.2
MPTKPQSDLKVTPLQVGVSTSTGAPSVKMDSMGLKCVGCVRSDINSGVPNDELHAYGCTPDVT